MSDVMLLGVLRMPLDMVLSDPLSIAQFYNRTQEAAARIESDAERIQALEAKCAELEKNDARYQWLRRRCFMIDSSDESAIVLSLFNDEGPTGEFLDDQIDAAIAAQAGSKEEA